MHDADNGSRRLGDKARGCGLWPGLVQEGRWQPWGSVAWSSSPSSANYVARDRLIGRQDSQSS